jgi:hypothetical protein
MAGGRDKVGEEEHLADLGARVRELLREDPRAGAEIRAARAGFLEEVDRRNAASNRRRPPARRPRRWLPPVVLSASIALGATAAWIWMRPVTFQIGGASQGRLGDVIEASRGSVLPLSFSDGSVLVLRQAGRIRVLSLEASAARVLVEDGVVDASIVHRQGGSTRWEFELGPYRVIVNGTRFRMAFRASDLALRVSTEEGRVTVAGGCLKAARMVSAGESLEPSCQRDKPQLDDTPGDEEEVLGPTPDPKPPTQAMPVDRWRQLLAAGRLLDGLRAAERAHFEHVCRIATAKELLALADAGRFFGPSRRAVTALGALRKRFAGSADAGTAAFMLGRIAFDEAHGYAQAARWFETYLLEEPRGPLMGDAFGRLMEARLRSRDSAGARTTAEHYLRRFPEGPYAPEARGILSK